MQRELFDASPLPSEPTRLAPVTRDEAIRMQDAFCDETGATPGLTIAGHLVAVPAIEARP